MKYRIVVHSLVVLALFLTLLPFAKAANPVKFTDRVYANQPSVFDTADLNNDGREDLITTCADGSQTLAISLSKGDGTFAPQVCYPPVQDFWTGIAVGDFNGDGYLDLAVLSFASGQQNTIYIYLNKGDGSFLSPKALVAPVTGLTGIVAGDFNHDGHIDLAFDDYTDQNLYIWLGKGDGTFTAGAVIGIQAPGYLQVGDFDGDGNADILTEYNLYTSSVQILYGDGHGNFEVTPVFGEDAFFHVYDLNGDGRSDLVGAPFDFSLNGNTYYSEIRVYYGNSNRTLTLANIPLKQCTAGGFSPAVADFNGDGIRDLAVLEGSNCKGGGPYTVDILAGKGDGTFEAEQSIYSSGAAGDLYPIRSDVDSDPDLRLYGYFQGTSNRREVFFLNKTAGSFPSCTGPYAGTGIALCSPTSEVVTSSPVKFSIGAANQTPGRKVEVWIDGKKAGEELDGWSYYSFLDAEYPVAVGTHKVTVYSAGWDNLLESTTFPLTVGGTTCAPPSSPGLNVCSPLNGAVVGSSATAWASGTVSGTIARMEVWVDGVKKYSTYGSDTLKKGLTLAAGTHSFAFYIVNTAGQKWEQTVKATVP